MYSFFFFFYTDALRWLANFRQEIEMSRKREQELKNNLEVFQIIQSNSEELAKIDKVLKLFAMKIHRCPIIFSDTFIFFIFLQDLIGIELVWQLTNEWNEVWERYKSEIFWKIDIEEMELTANHLFKKLTRLSKELKAKNWEIVEYSRSHVDKFRRTLPLITDLKNPAMRDRHWDKVKITTNLEFNEKSDEFTLESIANMQMQNYADEINDISTTASMELTIEVVNYKNL